MAYIRIYLDTRRKLKTNEYPVKIVVYHRNNIMISTGFSAKEKEFKDGQFTKLSANYSAKNANLNEYKNKIERKLLDLERDGKLNNLSDKELKNILTSDGNTKKSEFFSIFEDVINSRDAEKTKETYRYTLDVIKMYDGKVTFESINKAWLRKFESYLLTEKRMSVNTVSIHLRNLRAVFNFAIDDELTTAYPFRKFEIKKEETIHRDSGIEELKRIINYSGDLERYRDFFLLSLYLIGINMKDLANLKKTDYSKDRVIYRRLKTKRIYSIKVEPEAKEIMDRYKSDDGYLLDFIHLYKNYDGLKRGVNYFLKKLSDEQGVINEKLSTYYARHSWATIAASLDIPKETISAALGHSIGSEITSIYINFDQKKVDEANRKVIDKINGNKKK